MVEDLLADPGIIVSHQTVRAWAEKFGRRFANATRQRSAGNLGDKWHLDEVVLMIGGRKNWLWRAVDQGVEITPNIGQKPLILWLFCDRSDCGTSSQARDLYKTCSDSLSQLEANSTVGRARLGISIS
ncbi:hypothetical protein [Paracoccus aerodenitrificans]|uniref:hypothetical protein n=1 Tax=Paracoccus aerodenitrificans TaxID=3017781 RepID=UPI003EBE03AA